MSEKMQEQETEIASLSRGGYSAIAAPQMVDEQAVRTLFQAEGAEAARGLVGTGVAYRHDWGNLKGQVILPLNWSFVKRNSLVFVSIGEGLPGGGKFIGDARYTVHNVAMSDGRIDVWVNIEWSYPIRIYVDYLVINP